MEKILKAWPIQVASIRHIQNEVWEINGSHILKGSSDDRFAYLPDIYKNLKPLGIATPELIKTRDGTYCHQAEKIYLLMEKVIGIHLTVEDVMASEHFQMMLGQAMANFHLASKDLNIPVWDNHFLDEIKGWIHEELQTLKDSNACQNFEFIRQSLESMDSVLDRQIIHRDLHLNNLVYTQQEDFVWIDLDLLQKNYRMFDLAYLLVGWTIDKTHDAAYMEGWSETVVSILKAYDSISGVSKVEEESLYLLMAAIELLFVAYFQKIGQDELAQSADRCLKWLVDYKLKQTSS